jgi:ectoine hydroxylase-related dioxygenase (phytanoyl-CoA dioxygenase family)
MPIGQGSIVRSFFAWLNYEVSLFKPHEKKGGTTRAFPEQQQPTMDNATCDLHQVYQERGFVGPLDVLTLQEAAETLQKFNDWATTLPNNCVSGNNRFKPHLFLPFISRIVHHPKLLAAVQDVLQTRHVLCWSSDFNIKQAASSDSGESSMSYYAPHQDSTYAGLQPIGQVVTAWVALSDPVGENEGCLSFWSGSHKHGQLRHVEELQDSNNQLSRGQRVQDSRFDTANNVSTSLPLRGGQASLHSFLTVHQSGPNRSRKPRVGLAIRYMSASVKQSKSTAREMVTLVSGEVKHNGFDLEPVLALRPTEKDIEIGKQAHAEAMRREAANYFDDSTHASAYDELITQK